MSASLKEWAVLLARLVVGGWWLWLGLPTLGDPFANDDAVRAYDLLPVSLVEPVATTLPAVAVVVGLALVGGVMTRGAALISAVLLVALTIGSAAAPDVLGVVGDLALLAASGLVVRAGPGRLALDSALHRRRTPRDRERELDTDLERVD